jgi:hypothetical protein
MGANRLTSPEKRESLGGFEAEGLLLFGPPAASACRLRKD